MASYPSTSAVNNSMATILDTIKRREAMLKVAEQDAANAKSRLAEATKLIAEVKSQIADLGKQRDVLRKKYNDIVAEQKKVQRSPGSASVTTTGNLTIVENRQGTETFNGRKR